MGRKSKAPGISKQTAAQIRFRKLQLDAVDKQNKVNATTLIGHWRLDGWRDTERGLLYMERIGRHRNLLGCSLLQQTSIPKNSTSTSANIHRGNAALRAIDAYLEACSELFKMTVTSFTKPSSSSVLTDTQERKEYKQAYRILKESEIKKKNALTTIAAYSEDPLEALTASNKKEIIESIEPCHQYLQSAFGYILSNRKAQRNGDQEYMKPIANMVWEHDTLEKDF